MLPEPIGTTYLLVHEAGGWLPARDTRLPAQRNPEQPKFVVYEDSFSHRYRPRSEDAEVEFGRGDTLQVCRICEEGEDLLSGQRQGRGCAEKAEPHAPIVVAGVVPTTGRIRLAVSTKGPKSDPVPHVMTALSANSRRSSRGWSTRSWPRPPESGSTASAASPKVMMRRRLIARIVAALSFASPLRRF